MITIDEVIRARQAYTDAEAIFYRAFQEHYQAHIVTRATDLPEYKAYDEAQAEYTRIVFAFADEVIAAQHEGSE